MMKKHFVSLLAAVALALAPIIDAFSYSKGGSTAYTFVNVFDYLNPAQQTDVRTWGGAQDVTTPITNAIAAISSTGGVLYFPPGRYVTSTCNFTIANPTTLMGDGSATYASTTGIAQIECSSNTATLFTITALMARIANIALVDKAASRSAGAAIFTNGSDTLQRVDYDGVLVSGFWDGIDVGVGQGWSLRAGQMLRQLHWGIRIRNTVNADAGDASISDTVFNPKGATTALAAIRYESSGGLKLNSVKVVVDSGSLINGISASLSGSEQFLMSNLNIEGVTGAPIDIEQGWPFIKIQNSYLNASGGGPAIVCKVCGQFTAQNNNLVGTGSAAISLTTNSLTTITDNNLNAFDFDISGGGSTTFVRSTTPTTVAKLVAASAVQPGSSAIVTDANQTTWGASVTGGGSVKTTVHSDGSNWLVGG